MNKLRLGITLTPNVSIELHNALKERHLRASYINQLVKEACKEAFEKSGLEVVKVKNSKRIIGLSCVFPIDEETLQILNLCKKYFGLSKSQIGRYAINKWLGEING